MARNYQIVKKDRKGLDPVKKPTVLDIAWAAGIYEGEGSCLAGGNGNRSFSMQLSQKDPELLYKLRDLFGGTVKQYANGAFLVYRWTCCGDRGRVFLGAIYPYLTSRRKAQIESTSAWNFLKDVQDLIQYKHESNPCHVYQGLCSSLEKYVSAQREKAAESRRAYLRDFEKRRSEDPEYREKKRLEVARRRKLKKEELQAATKLVAIA
jgi:hypothetical protein